MASSSVKPTVPAWISEHASWERLEDQLKWYDTKSTSCQRKYKYLKCIQISLAVIIPVISISTHPFSNWANAISGATIALLEGVQHMNQYSTLWVTYRTTAEYLKHEKFLFLSAAGPYRQLEKTESLILLAERVEERVSSEHANWFNENKPITANCVERNQI